MNKPRGLGKGLGAIFQEKNLAHRDDLPGVPPTDGSMVAVLALAQIQPNPFQPRKEFNPTELEELAASIREKGVFQPILVRRQGANFQIIAGERRFRASLLAGKETIPALVRDQVSDREMREIALLENIQRVQLNPIEEALAFQELINSCGYTHDQLSHQLGKSRPAITNSLRLLRLVDGIQQQVASGTLSAGHARVLAALDPARQSALAQQVAAQGWSVRTLESKAGQVASPPKTPKRPGKSAGEDANRQAFLRELALRLGTRVHLETQPSGKGYLRLDFHSNSDLSRLADILLGLNAVP
ncbi:MAG TPA: ParB/RepB/Spo0J family partition protein [Fibrobacteria bacterium]|nr:ParB/RepB/Spo0J family partition protein [Fibrobacteria bacterium]